MSEQEKTSDVDTTPRFNVWVRVPKNGSLELIEKRALQELGFHPDSVSRLMNAFQSSPQVQVGKEIAKEKVDSLRNDYERMGLELVVTPVLALQAMDAIKIEKAYTCPACDAAVTLPANRQCPQCGIFVDKVTDEFLLKKKIEAQERAAIEFRASKDAAERDKKNKLSMEAAIRAKIREELEEEFGLKDAKQSIFAGRPGLIRAVGLLVLVGAAFGGGFFVNKILSPKADNGENNSGATKGGQNVDQLLASAGPKSVGGTDSASEIVQDGASGDDSLLASAEQGRSSGKTLTVEQAVAAANALSGAIGGPTTHSLDKNLVGGTASGANHSANSASANKGSGESSSIAGETSTVGAGAQGSSTPSSAVSLPLFSKASLIADFAVHLAQSGQGKRASEVVKTLQMLPGISGNPQANAVSRLAALQVQAWRVGELPGGNVRDQVESLRSSASAIANPADRAVALSKCGSILGRNASLPKQLSIAFFSLSSEAVKTLTQSEERTEVNTVLLAEMAVSSLSDVTDKVQKGLWIQAQAASENLDGIVRQAPMGIGSARMHAANSLAKGMLGMVPKADASLTSTLTAIDKEASVAKASEALQILTWDYDLAYNDRVLALAAQLALRAETKSGLEKAEALAELAILFANANQSEKLEAFAKRALEVEGVDSSARHVIKARLLVRSELAASRNLQRSKLFAESEARIKRVAGLLL
jgi:hypothetical protein